MSENVMHKKSFENVKLYRYVRPLELDLTRVELTSKPTGGITFYFEINQQSELLCFTSVICRDDENFNFKISKAIAKGRFEKGLYGVSIYNRNLSLVDNVLNGLELENNLPDHFQTLKSKLKSIKNNNQTLSELHMNIINQVTNKHSEYVNLYANIE
jgi:hypothetical protein